MTLHEAISREWDEIGPLLAQFRAVHGDRLTVGEAIHVASLLQCGDHSWDLGPGGVAVGLRQMIDMEPGVEFSASPIGVWAKIRGYRWRLR